METCVSVIVPAAITENRTRKAGVVRTSMTNSTILRSHICRDELLSPQALEAAVATTEGSKPAARYVVTQERVTRKSRYELRLSRAQRSTDHTRSLDVSLTSYLPTAPDSISYTTAWLTRMPRTNPSL